MALSKQDLKARTLAGMEEEERFQKSNEIKGKITKIANTARQAAASQEARANKEKDLLGADSKKVLASNMNFISAPKNNQEDISSRVIAPKIVTPKSKVPAFSAKAVSSEAPVAPIEKRDYSYIASPMDRGRQTVSDSMALRMGVSNQTLNNIRDQGAQKYGKDIVTESFQSGVANTLADTVGGLEYLYKNIPTVSKSISSLINGEDYNPFSAINAPLQKWQDEKALDVEQAVAEQDNSKGARFASQVVTAGTQMIPDVVLSLATGGASTVATAGTKAAKGLKALTSVKNLIPAIKQVAVDTVKNPSFWLNFEQMLSPEYEAAIANGASEKEANITALLSAFAQAKIESVTGFQNLPQKTTPSVTKAVIDYVKSAIAEGNEEVLQSITSGIAQKLVYDHDKDWIAKESGEDAVLNMADAYEEWVLGTFLGGVMSAPGTMINIGKVPQTTVENVAPIAEPTVPPIDTPVAENVMPAAEASTPPINATLPNVENVASTIENNQQVPFANGIDTQEEITESKPQKTRLENLFESISNKGFTPKYEDGDFFTDIPIAVQNYISYPGEGTTDVPEVEADVLAQAIIELHQKQQEGFVPENASKEQLAELAYRRASWLKKHQTDNVNVNNSTGDGGFGANTVGAAQSNPNSYAHLQNEHGVHDLGENPRARDANVPLMDAQGKRTSKSVATIMEAKVTPDELIPAFEREVVAGTFENKGTSNKEAVEKAAKRIADKTFKDAVSDFKTLYSDDKLLSKDDLVYGELLFSMAAQSGEANTAMEIASLLSSNNSRTGDAMQAQRILKRLSPEGRLYHTQRIVEKINKDNKQKNKIVLDEETVNKIINARTDKEIEEASEFAAEKIAKQIDRGFFSDLAGMWNAWRYLSMLGNPKTHIRNIFGNVVFLPVRKVKNVVKAGIEDVAIKAGKLDEKTATIKSVSKETKDFAKRNFEENKKVLLSGGNYRFESEIEAAKKDFYLGGEQTPVKKFFNDVLTPVRKASEFNSNSLEAEDVWFFREAYVDSFGQYLTANGIDAANITNEQRTKAENYAAQEAKKATYRDASALANALEKFSNTKIKVKGNEIKLRPFVDAVLPFRKTPINILSRGIEYSPVGLASSLALDGKAVKNGDITANEMIDHISSGLTGTGIFALGMFLAAKNIVSGGESDDEKEKAFDKLTGEQAYALNIGNGSYTIDWLSPTVLPLFAGVETWKVLQKEYGKDATWDQTAWAIISNLDKIANPMLELSMLSSLEQFLGKNYGKEGSALSGLAQDLLASYVLQAVPTIFSQVAQTMDGTRRNAYYVDKTDNIPDKWQIPLQRAMAKIPGLSQKLPVYVDAWGREQKQSENIGIRALENFVSPGYYKKKNATIVDEVVKQVYADTGDSSVLPTYIPKNFNVNGERLDLSANQYTDAQKTKGSAEYSILSQLVVDKDFKKMSAEDQAEVIKDVYSYATVKGKQKVSDYTTDTKWYKNMEEAQKNENIKPTDFLVNRSVYNNLEGTEARSKDMMMYDHLIADKSTSDKEDLAILKYVAGVDFSKYEKATDKPNAILSAYNIIKTEEAKGGEGTQDRIIKQLIADKNTTAKEDLAILENVRSVNFDDYKKAANNNADKTLYLYSLLKSENAKGEQKEKDVDIEAIQKKFKEDVYGAREIYYKAKGDWNEDVSDVLENGTNRDKKVAVFERFKYSDEEITKGYNAVIGLSKKDDMMKALKKAFGNTSKATVFYNILKGKKGYK